MPEDNNPPEGYRAPIMVKVFREDSDETVDVPVEVAIYYMLDIIAGTLQGINHSLKVIAQPTGSVMEDDNA